MHRIACATIDTGALRHNFQLARQLAGGSKIMCVIKANAYGHGMLEVAEALGDADGFAVACVDEALALRQRGTQQAISVFQGFADEDELAACVEYSLWPVLHDLSQLAMLENARGKRPARLWLKLSTGMNRLGFAAGDVASLWRRTQGLSGIEHVGLLTHMACADEAENTGGDTTSKQITCFDQHTSGLAGEQSLANSAAMIAWPAARRHWVRPGIMLYGASPFLPAMRQAFELSLRPVMHLTSRLISIQQRARGDAIGYGGSWQCPEKMPVGAVAIGYGDGYPRAVDRHACVVINGHRVPVVGRVSMDLLTVDLRGIDAGVGDEVTLWGPGLPVDEIADSAGTIAYELLCRMYGHVQYLYK